VVGAAGARRGGLLSHPCHHFVIDSLLASTGKTAPHLCRWSLKGRAWKKKRRAWKLQGVAWVGLLTDLSRRSQREGRWPASHASPMCVPCTDRPRTSCTDFALQLLVGVGRCSRGVAAHVASLLTARRCSLRVAAHCALLLTTRRCSLHVAALPGGVLLLGTPPPPPARPKPPYAQRARRRAEWNLRV
jgi:hypothetical protein